MSEIADIIKQISSKKNRISTFLAIVCDNEFKEVDGKTEFAVTVRKVIDPDLYEQYQEELNTSYRDGGIQSESGDGSKSEPDPSVIEIFNVRLKADFNELNEGVILKPRLGSWVLVSIIDNVRTKAYISQYSEIDSVLFKINKPEDPNAEDQETKYMEVKVDPAQLSIKMSDLMEGIVTKEMMDFKFYEAPESEDEDPKLLTNLTFDNGQLNLLAQDGEEEELTTLNINKAQLDLINKDGEESSVFALHTDKTQMDLTIADANVNLDANGLLVKNEGEDLLTTLLELVDVVAKIVVVQGTGPNVGALGQIQQKLNKILKS